MVDGYVAGVLAARTNFDPRLLRQIVHEGREAVAGANPDAIWS
jgi:hypothetical protein